VGRDIVAVRLFAMDDLANGNYSLRQFASLFEPMQYNCSCRWSFSSRPTRKNTFPSQIAGEP
jgi:hypothetical protein